MPLLFTPDKELNIDTERELRLASYELVKGSSFFWPACIL